jgi:hypothetical protein
MSLIGNIGYILMGFVLIVSIFLIILAFVEKKFKIRFLQGKHWRNQIYIAKLSKIDINNLDQSLKTLNHLAKSFFREAFHFQGSLEYSELEKLFKKKNNKKGAEFSKDMTKFLYSGKKITKPDLYKLITLLAEIIGSNKIITKEEQTELDKKSQQAKAKPLLRKINVLGIGKKKVQDKEQNSKQKQIT